MAAALGPLAGPAPELWTAVHEGRLATVKELLTHPETHDVDETGGIFGTTPLMEAATSACNTDTCVSMILELLAHGADMNLTDTRGLTSLHHVVCCSRVVPMGVMLQKGANVAATAIGGDTPLHHAASIGSVDMVMFLVRHGANLNAQNAIGLTPLMMAVQGANQDTVIVLLALGADVTLQTY